ncbi:hypothetical protein [Actinotalea sp. C106]|uniref:hypothetical protein n=1 Tax=Actinotalea sp. C106 TaxID=2908644 RepID=UPI002029422A|nr:hypothetical protein [Actinotalea sp. C106]
MATSTAEWLDDQAGRLLTSQSASIDTSKLIVTFALAVSAGFLAAALQITRSGFAWTAVVAFGCSALLTLRVLRLARGLQIPDHGSVLADQTLQGDQAKLAALRRESFRAVTRNKPTVNEVRDTAWLQLMLSALAWGFAIAALVVAAV